MSEGGGWSVSDAVTFPFLPELNVPLVRAAKFMQ
jgi:hypothetical protein